MTTSLVDAESVLAIDLGSLQTQVSLFDVVDGQYHFIANGHSPSTANPPFQDVTESVHLAVERLQEITGRLFIDADAHFILPSQPDGSGVDRMVVTYSCGPELHFVTAGLLNEVSLESAQHLAASTYGKVLDSIGLSDRRRPETQIDAVLRAQPDLVILTGGTENGASSSILKQVELLTMVCRVLPQANRPDVLYVGNQALSKRITETLEKWTNVTTAANVRPSIDTEDLGPAQTSLNKVLVDIRSRQVGGMDHLAKLSSSLPVPNAYAFGRLIQYLGQTSTTGKGVLGVDLGASYTTFAAANHGGHLCLNAFPYGIGRGLVQAGLLHHLDELMQWLPVHVNESLVRDYLMQKSLFPAGIPLTGETLAIEQALARYLMRTGMAQMHSRWPELGSAFEPILAVGSALSYAPTPGQALLAILDGIQPAGITTVILDPHKLSPQLGAIASINNLLPVQVLESDALLNLGTVICPVSPARYGTTILRVRLEYEDGNEIVREIRQGTLVSLPLRPGQVARIRISSSRRTLIDPHTRRGSGSF
ncbi:MAG: glutamate mutase L, partial [Anaerolineaceae bacterium]|nr:glutamate mutase L [Anaerolineaceae bacterium]